MAEIEFRNLEKVFPGGTAAVEDFDLLVEDGEFMVLVGPSGSGKTTVLRITAGLEAATSGNVLIGGAVVDHVPPTDRNVAMVFQNYALYPHMSVYDNIAFGLKRHRVPKREIRARVDAAAKMLAIADLLKRKPAQLSGGQRQRVAMGRAIVREPDAFLMDEPLSNLDAKLRVEMRAYLGSLHQRLRTTTLYVTHDQTEAMTMGDRVAVMRDGHLQQVADPRTLYRNPVNIFVAGFIGSPAMNLVRSRLLARDGRLFAKLGGIELRLPAHLLEHRKLLGEHVGRPVVLGIRPEAFEDAALADRNGQALDARVTLAEALGPELIAHFQLGGSEATLTARLDPRSSARAGEQLRLAVDLERLHFFDPETEEAL